MLFVAVPFVLGAALMMSGKGKLRRHLNELRAAGLPTNMAELNDYYAIPVGSEDTTELWLTAINGVNNDEFNYLAKNLPFLGPAESPTVGQEWPELEAAKSFLANHAAELASIRTAASASGAARFPIDFKNPLDANLQHAQGARGVARFLSLDAHVSQCDGKHDQVLADIIDTFAMADALQREPVLVSQLMRLAIYAIGCNLAKEFLPACEWNDAQLAKLQAAAARMDANEGLALAMNGERAIGLFAIDKMPSATGLGNVSKIKLIRLYDEMVAGFEKPWNLAIAEQQAVADRLKANRGLISDLLYFPVNLLTPTLEQVSQSGARSACEQACMITAIAAQRHRLAHGEFPASLNEISIEHLPPGFKSTNWMDPFTGQPLMYLKTEAGLTIYSTGLDRVDDGGDILEREVGQPTDMGFFIKL